MKQSISLSSLTDGIQKFFAKYHSIIFFVVIGALLGVALVMVLAAINYTLPQNEASANSVNTSFDETTIKRLRQLSNPSSQPEDVTLDIRRATPFSE